MAGSSHKEILFVFQGQKQSKRSQELQDARRRAHAARHAARKFKDLHPATPAAVVDDGVDGRVEVQDVVTRPQRGPVRRFPALPPIETLLGGEDDRPAPAQRGVESPFSILSQDMTDPFRTTVVGTLPTVLQRYLHDGKSFRPPQIVALTHFAQHKP
jgi:hypothetical protein